MFEDRTFEVIIEEMLDEVPDDMDKREGSIIYNALAPAAAKLAQVYISLSQVLVLGFPQTSEGEYLEMIAEEEGVQRNYATPSIRHFQTSGSGQITEGDRFFVDDIYFVAEETIEIPGVFRAKSEETGAMTAIYNPDTILPVESIEGLESITMVLNHENDIDGINEESDESLLRRYWERVENSPGPGNNSDYIRWAKEVNGVGNVLVEPLWKGEGTVRVVILNPEGKQAHPSLVEEVQELIDPGARGLGEGKAPPGAKVTVATAEVTQVTATIPSLVNEPEYNIEQVRVNAEEALRNYLRRINPGGIIRIREAVAEIIHAPGVLDMGDLLINGSRKNIELSVMELVDLGEVHFT